MLKPTMSKKLVIDIETVGKDFDSLDEISKEYLLKFAESDEEIKVVREGLGFSPLTGEIVAIGMLNPDTNNGAVYFQAPEVLQEAIKEDGIEFVADTVSGVLR